MRGSDWREIAACKGMSIDLFFPNIPVGRTGVYDDGKAVCAKCAVRPSCMKLAEEFVPHGDRYGLFGGLTPTERRLLRQRTKREARDARCA